MRLDPEIIQKCSPNARQILRFYIEYMSEGSNE